MAISKTWSLTKTNYYTDFFVVPFLIAASIIWMGFSWYYFVLGSAIWSLTEYIIHRYVFHRVFRREHWLHHTRESEYVGISAVKSVALVLLVLGVSYLAGISLVCQGFLFGYLLYIVVHDAIHHPGWLSKCLPAEVKESHLAHHRHGDEMNFGVTSTIWDRILGTFKE